MIGKLWTLASDKQQQQDSRTIAAWNMSRQFCQKNKKY
jgi:hypothetical protein